MFSARNKNTSKTALRIRGYTVIEILIVIVIMTLIFGVGTASYRSFQRRKALDGATNQVVSHLRMAQEMALAGIKPSGCENQKIVSINFMCNKDSNYYTIRALCWDGFVNNYYLALDYYPNLKPRYGDIYWGYNQTVRFLPLGKGVESDVVLRLVQAETGKSKYIKVTTGGEIIISDTSF